MPFSEVPPNPRSPRVFAGMHAKGSFFGQGRFSTSQFRELNAGRKMGRLATSRDILCCRRITVLFVREISCQNGCRKGDRAPDLGPQLPWKLAEPAMLAAGVYPQLSHRSDEQGRVSQYHDNAKGREARFPGVLEDGSVLPDMSTDVRWDGVASMDGGRRATAPCWGCVCAMPLPGGESGVCRETLDDGTLASGKVRTAQA